MLTLQSHCAVVLLRDNLSLQAARGHRCVEEIVQMKLKFETSTETANRHSGCLSRVMASYPTLSEAIRDISLPNNLARCGACEEIDALKYMKANTSEGSEFMERCLSGSLCLDHTPSKCLCITITSMYHCCKLWSKFSSLIMGTLFKYPQDMSSYTNASLAALTRSIRGKVSTLSCLRSLDINMLHQYRGDSKENDVYHSLIYFPNQSIEISNLLLWMIKANAWNMVKWLVWLGIPLQMNYLYKCLYFDKFGMMTEQTHTLISNMGYHGVRWVWNYCSPLALQWVIHNVKESHKFLKCPCWENLTQLKVNILAESGIQFMSTFGNWVARRSTSLILFQLVVENCRSWNPRECYKQAQLHTSTRIGLQIARWVKLNYSKSNQGGQTLPCIISTRQIIHPCRRQTTCNRYA